MRPSCTLRPSVLPRAVTSVARSNARLGYEARASPMSALNALSTLDSAPNALITFVPLMHDSDASAGRSSTGASTLEIPPALAPLA